MNGLIQSVALACSQYQIISLSLSLSLSLTHTHTHTHTHTQGKEVGSEAVQQGADALQQDGADALQQDGAHVLQQDASVTQRKASWYFLNQNSNP